MPSLTEKTAVIVSELRGEGICPDEADALESAARAYEEANLDLSSARKNKDAAGAAIVTSGVGGIACILGAETLVVPILCFVAGAGGELGGYEWGSGAQDSEEAAHDEVLDAIDELNTAIDKVCSCLESNL